MTLVVGIDIAKEFHWVTVVAVDTGKELVSRRMDNDPDAIAEFLGELAVTADTDSSVTVGVDVLGASPDCSPPWCSRAATGWCTCRA